MSKDFDTEVSYGLVDFVSGGPILDLPVMVGSSWDTQLNRPDAITCSVDMHDKDAKRLDLRSSTEPMKTIIFARNALDIVIAWGLIPSGGRTWNEDTQTLDLTAVGIESSWLGECTIGSNLLLNEELTVVNSDGVTVPNPQLDSIFSGLSHGTIGKRLLQGRLTFPGAPTVFDLPPDELGFRSQPYLFSNLKKIGPALSDLTDQEGGPDFAFDAARASNGVGLRYIMRHGSEANPRLGSPVGSWGLGGPLSPISKLKQVDAVAAGASLGLASAGRSAAVALMSRVRNTSLIASGYPPFDVIDTEHSDVTRQTTLDSYNRQNMADAAKTIRDLSFTVRGDASPGLGQYRPGDTLELTAPDGHPWLPTSTPIRIMSMSGDETGKEIEIGCVILDA